MFAKILKRKSRRNEQRISQRRRQLSLSSTDFFLEGRILLTGSDPASIVTPVVISTPPGSTDPTMSTTGSVSTGSSLAVSTTPYPSTTSTTAAMNNSNSPAGQPNPLQPPVIILPPEVPPGAAILNGPPLNFTPISGFSATNPTPVTITSQTTKSYPGPNLWISNSSCLSTIVTVVSTTYSNGDINVINTITGGTTEVSWVSITLSAAMNTMASSSMSTDPATGITTVQTISPVKGYPGYTLVTTSITTPPPSLSFPGPPPRWSPQRLMS